MSRVQGLSLVCCMGILALASAGCRSTQTGPAMPLNTKEPPLLGKVNQEPASGIIQVSAKQAADSCKT